jgi:integrase
VHPERVCWHSCYSACLSITTRRCDKELPRGLAPGTYLSADDEVLYLILEMDLLEERVRKAGLWEDHGLIFSSEVGTPMSGRNLYRAFKIRVKRAALPQTLRFHDLRHTCATLLLRQGINLKFVQELLGHADISLTLNTYSHVLPDMGDAAAGGMDAALG